MRLRPRRPVAVARPTKALVGRPRFRRALWTGAGALLTLAASPAVPHHPHTVTDRVLVDLPAVVFLALAVACVRSVASEVDALARWRGERTAGSAIHMVITGFGYTLALVGTLSMLSVPIGHLLLGGAIAGIVIGIAAQQSLGNVFAGFVLLTARPFALGNHIRVRSGALGGEFYGTVTSMSLTYVSVLTDDGMLKVPNASLLAAAVGPWDPAASRTSSPGPEPGHARRSERTDDHARRRAIRLAEAAAARRS